MTSSAGRRLPLSRVPEGGAGLLALLDSRRARVYAKDFFAAGPPSVPPTTLGDVAAAISDMDKVFHTSFGGWITSVDNIGYLATFKRGMFADYFKEAPDKVINALQFISADWPASAVAELLLKMFYVWGIDSPDFGCLVKGLTRDSSISDLVDLASIILIGENPETSAAFFHTVSADWSRAKKKVIFSALLLHLRWSPRTSTDILMSLVDLEDRAHPADNLQAHPSAYRLLKDTLRAGWSDTPLSLPVVLGVFEVLASLQTLSAASQIRDWYSTLSLLFESSLKCPPFPPVHHMQRQDSGLDLSFRDEALPPLAPSPTSDGPLSQVLADAISQALTMSSESDNDPPDNTDWTSDDSSGATLSEALDEAKEDFVEVHGHEELDIESKNLCLEQGDASDVSDGASDPEEQFEDSEDSEDWNSEADPVDKTLSSPNASIAVNFERALSLHDRAHLRFSDLPFS